MADIRFGSCSEFKYAQDVLDAGFDYFEGGVSEFLMPDKTDEEWNAFLAKAQEAKLTPEACNGFIPGSFRLTGETADHDPALDYAEKACRRADIMSVKFIVFGSGGARAVPEGFDYSKARAQFIDFCKKLAARIADCKVTVVLEPLNSKECNFLNSVDEGIGFVDEINSPKIQLLADFYHMGVDGEGPESIVKAGKRIMHCHIAETDGRTAPGMKGQDFSPFFDALKKIDYNGRVSCECNWPWGDGEWQPARIKALETLKQAAR